jgi:hypothetical protein
MTLFNIIMKLPWFKRIGILYIPKTLIGWILMMAGIGYSVYLFINTDSRSHSVSDTLMNFAYNLLIIIIVYSLIGLLTSRKARM